MRSGLLRITPALATALMLGGCPGEDGEEAKTPVINAFSASEMVVARGDNVLLTWDVTDATSVSIDAAPGGTLVVGSALASGVMESAAIDGDTTFTLTALGTGGKSATKTLMVTVDLNRVAITSFDALPNPARIGGTTTLSWDTLGATRVRILRDDMEVYVAAANEISSGDYVTDPINVASVKFSIVASNDSDMRTDEITVTTVSPPVISTFTATPPTFIGASVDVTLAWTVQNAMELSLLANSVEVPGFDPDDISNGTFMITVSETTQFELVAANFAGETRQIAVVATVQTEVEPNNSIDEANVLTAGAVSGMITMGDVDWFQIEVPDGGSVYAETSDGMGGCAFDTLIRLWDDDEIELGSNDNKGGMGMGMGMGTGRCSKIDPVLDGFAADLLDGTYYVSVEGANNELGPYTLVVVVNEAACGNGILELDELCDDGNLNAGDGCDASCVVELSGTVMGGGGTITVNIGPQGLALIEVILANNGQSIEAIAKDPLGGCTLESNLLLRDSDRTLITIAQSDAEGGECAEFAFPEGSRNIDLAAGSYFIDIENPTDLPAMLSIEVTIHDPACGNRAIESSRLEQCDDGNTIAGDGCDAMCRFEPLGSVMGPPGMGEFIGSIDPADQLDLYRVTLAAPGYITAETFTPVLDACTATTSDTVIDVYDDALTTELASNDDREPGVPCSRLAPDARDDLLAAGSYWVIVRSFAESLVPAYAVRIQLTGVACGNGIIEPGETCDDANVTAGDGCDAVCAYEGTLIVETEPNDGVATANNTGVTLGGGSVLVTGAIDPIADPDLFAVDIAGMGTAIRAVTHTAPNDVDECIGADTAIDLLDGSGAVIATNDDDGPGVCSLINPAVDAPMGGLPPGRYYLRIRHYNDSRTIPLYFATISIE